MWQRDPVLSKRRRETWRVSRTEIAPFVSCGGGATGVLLDTSAAAIRGSGLTPRRPRLTAPMTRGCRVNPSDHLAVERGRRGWRSNGLPAASEANQSPGNGPPFRALDLSDSLGLLATAVSRAPTRRRAAGRAGARERAISPVGGVGSGRSARQSRRRRLTSGSSWALVRARKRH